MGLLDDAIREHLDLKRRRGADPAEVERAEREALGPVRRNRDPADGPELAQPAAAATSALDEDFAPEYEDDGDWVYDADAGVAGAAEAGEVDPVARVGADSAFDAPPSAEERFEDGRALGDPGLNPPEAHGEDWGDAAASVHETGPAPLAPDSRPVRDLDGGETAEYRLHDELSPEEDDGEDVLEETPEFLQDTPDHDRLWFEQRPPRDFDFDG